MHKRNMNWTNGLAKLAIGKFAGNMRGPLRP